MDTINAVTRRLDAMQAHAAITAHDIAELFDTTPETVSCWRRGQSDPQADRLERFLTLDWAIERLAEFYVPDAVRRWLFSPHKLLGDKTPADCLGHGQCDDVLAVLDALRDGAYV